MAQNPVGTMFVELDLDDSKFTRKQKEILQSANSTSTEIETNFKRLGGTSDAMYTAMRQSAQNSFAGIANSSKASAAEIQRAQEALTARINSLNEQQFGKQTSLIDNLKGHWIAATVAVAAAVGVANKAWDLAKLGAGYQEQQGILDNLSRKYGTTADVIVAEMQRAGDYQIAKTELMQISLAGLAKGLVPDQLTKLADAALILGDAVGKDATTALRDLTEALETGRTKGLKTYLGTTLDLETAFGDLAGKMTAAEKTQAMYNITMIAATDLQAQQTKKVDDAADKLERLETKYKDVTLTMATWAKTAVVGTVDLFSGDH